MLGHQPVIGHRPHPARPDKTQGVKPFLCRQPPVRLQKLTVCHLSPRLIDDSQPAPVKVNET
jgi:hypothetical protein